MFKRKKPKNYITLVQDKKIRIENTSSKFDSILQSLGGQKDELEGNLVWILRCEDDTDLGTILGKLRDAGALFESSPTGWPPAAVFAKLRDQGLVGGEFKEVIWKGPGNWRVQPR